MSTVVSVAASRQQQVARVLVAMPQVQPGRQGLFMLDFVGVDLGTDGIGVTGLAQGVCAKKRRTTS